MKEEDYEFYRFIAKYAKSYETKEELQKRAEIFGSNLRYIQEKNSQNGATYKLGVNKFADMTNEEFKKSLGRKKDLIPKDQIEYRYLNETAVPDFIDWRVKGAVN